MSRNLSFEQISDDIEYCTLYNRRSMVFHGYVLPFLILYAIVGYIWVFAYGIQEHLELGIISIAVVAGLQILTSLFCMWSVHVNCALTCTQASSVDSAEWVKVVPTLNNGCPELVKLHSKKSGNAKRTWFFFQKMCYVYDGEEKRQFEPVRFPLASSMATYVNSKGYCEEADLTLAEQQYGKNLVELDIPKFWELFKERATAPFFVFQVFCVGLWCLDDYWYYSLFTLVMLGAFEATLVQQQLRNMSEIRKMSAKPYMIQTYRGKRWKPLLSSELLPGDLVSISRSQEDRLVPCDLLLLKGSCIVDESMLTGESVPVMKEPVDGRESRDMLDLALDGKLHVLYGGTKVVQHSSPVKTGTGIKPGDGGCLAYVLRNGFSTSQGKLLRTILYSVKRVTANNLETFLFILFLLVFAVAAASYVWIYGTVDARRNRYKLFLECTLILTSVVPPELPIELSLAVNTSLLALSKLYVFCTEPFRIPFAGKVDVCCFDKTGTLTSDKLVVEGVAGINGLSDITPVDDCPLPTLHVLATCHSLALLDDELVGDPLEKATLNAANWSLTRGDAVIPNKLKTHGLKIFQRFHFSSALKRMSVICGHTATGSLEVDYTATVKGAPETLRPRFRVVPESYESVYLELARRGARVLALGYKKLGVLSHQQLRETTRDLVECDLDFAGFVIISCPLKSDSRAVIKEIQQSTHHTVMITGDNPLTACHVARELRMCRKHSCMLLLAQTADSGGNLEVIDQSASWQWRSIDGSVTLPVKTQRFELENKYDLCLTGEGLIFMNTRHPRLLRSLLSLIKVYARVAPQQKELVITSLKQRGFVTLMCGDGTNDVGALKHAHVGVALLANAPERLPQAKSRPQESSVDFGRSSASKSPLAGSTKSGSGKRAAKLKAMSAAVSKQSGLSSTHQQKLQKMLDDMEQEAAVVKLGDASIAAPFTYKLSSPQCVCHIIKQGRCTLVTTLQMFKILALNALVLAYSQSALYLQGVKMSDTQATMQGLLLAGCFLFITRSKPLQTLSRQRPLANIFNLYTLLTVLGQFALHFSALYFLVSRALLLERRQEDEYIDLEADFKPSLLNSTVYIISMTLQVSTFAVNYKGLPFMERLWDNKPLLYSLLFSGLSIFGLASGFAPDAAQQFEMVEFPEEFRVTLLQVLFADLIGAFLIDRLLQLLFCRTKLKND